jgi:hypothetical protein
VCREWRVGRGGRVLLRALRVKVFSKVSLRVKSRGGEGRSVCAVDD